MSGEGGALENVEETSKLYKETTVKIEQPASGCLRVSQGVSSLNFKKPISLYDSRSPKKQNKKAHPTLLNGLFWTFKG